MYIIYIEMDRICLSEKERCERKLCINFDEQNKLLGSKVVILNESSTAETPEELKRQPFLISKELEAF